MKRWGMDRRISTILLALLAIGAAAAAAEEEEDEGAAPWVSLTVSPLLTTTPKRQLELHWAHARPRPGDWLGLFAGDPDAALRRAREAASATAGAEEGAGGAWLEGVALARVELGDAEGGHALTGVEAPRDAHEVTHCAAYVRVDAAARARGLGGERVLARECARMQPEWMGALRTALGPLRLREVLLPGTHDSGAYRLYSPSVPQTLVEKYSITQEEDIGTQLELGVRYLDMRVGHYPSTSARWWINHGVVRLHRLSDALDDLRAFVRAHPSELVVFDIQEFPVGFGADLSVHHDLVAFLASELEELLVPPSLGWDATLAQFWAQGRRVILAYDSIDVINAEPTAPLWRSPRQLWGNVRTLAALRDYLHLVLGPYSSPQTSAHAAMAELTPNAWDVVLDTLGGLRNMADAVNGEVTDLLRDELAPRTNAFAVDFVRGTDVVRVAIDFNRRRGEALRRQRARAPADAARTSEGERETTPTRQKAI